MLTARNRRFCHQFLGVLPVALTGLLMEAVTRACNPGMNYWLPWLLGMFAGILLVNASRRKAMPHAAMPAVAGMAASAAQAPAAVSSAAAAVATGAAGAVGGAAIGIAGAYFGAKASIENTRSPRERRFMIRMTWWCMAGALLFTLAIFALTWLGRSLGQKHPVCFGVLVAVVIVVYSVGLTVFILLANRRQRQIRLEDQAAAEAGRRVG
jgi:preprotein translocase subunit SecG